MDPFTTRPVAPNSRPDPGPAKRRRALVSLVVLIPVTTALWALAAFASVSFLDTFRLMATNDIDGWGDGVGSLDGGPVVFFGAVFPASLFGFAVMWQSTSAFATFKAGATLSGAVGSGGAAVGLLVAWLGDRWTEPRAVGQFASAGDGTSDWGPLSWIAYHASWLLPVVFGGMAAIGLLRFVSSHRRGRWADTKAAEIKEHGIRMPGTIDRVVFTNTWIMGNPQFEVTVTYVAKYGPRQAIQRFVTPAMSAPTRGGQVDVWYDPLGDEGTVLVELTERSSDHGFDPGLFPR
ncbi:hypothetical protein [Streptomyces profundus]|uniref:hypothetical protein n=1 Tax=Streptomyces profundus TaxID=2867410 RepID=UPI001D16CD6A|nr:hypothetical protein [Streptomyces sp. MA3_2.13]UED84704.1 hypothetical protein K4G22_11205 [Streptomyces sp. MA3_2.13]